MRTLLIICLVLILAAVITACRCDSDVGRGAENTSRMSSSPSAARNSDPSIQVSCPVCGLRFGQSEAEATYQHDGRTYYFLLEDHKDAFAADPAQFSKAPAPGNSIYEGQPHF